MARKPNSGKPSGGDDAAARDAGQPASGQRGTEAPQAAHAPYVVLARKYRPRTFDDLIGQGAMVQTLKNAFAQGRIAQGYMLTGVRGIGKTTTARILARALNYERDGIERPTIDIAEPGRHCAEIMESRHPDVVEMDAASNTSIDNVREIIESARYKPLLARYKVFIIDEVHMLSKSAFNALLKTLEEPPEHVKFIFATTEIRKVPVTVLSRCQRFDLRRVDVPELMAHFRRIVAEEGAAADDDALALVARAAEGSVRDGLSILDQAIAMGSGRVSADAVRAMLGLADRGRILDLFEQMMAGDARGALAALSALHRDGAEPVQVLTDLAEAVHAVSRHKAAGGDGAEDIMSAEERRRVASLSSRLSMPLLARAWQMLVKGLEEAGRAPDRLAAADMVLIRICYAADLPSPDDVIKALSGGAVPAGRGAPRGERPSGDTRGTMNAAASAPRAASEAEAGAAAEAFDEAGERFEGDPGFAVEAEELGLDDPGLAAAAALPDPRSFAEVVDLAGQRRDAKLKVHLEEHVSLVKFDAAARSIDLYLLEGAPAELANELREKLNAWTSRRWIVMLSRAKGAAPLGEVRRAEAQRELDALKAQPAVKAVLDLFPEARVTVKRVTGGGREDTGTG